MDKKEIASGLLKIANTLDNMGLMEEANIVDRVAKKIVVSENPKYPRINVDKARRIMPTGDYTKDIITYKSLIYDSYHDKNDKFVKGGIEPYKTLAYNFKIRAIEKLEKEKSTQEAKAFESQANRIKYDFEDDIPDINEMTTTKLTLPLNAYLAKYGITDYYGNLSPNIENLEQLNTQWFNFKQYLLEKTKSKSFIPYLSSQLSKTYNILKAKFE
jgi:hypothetical protein